MNQQKKNNYRTDYLNNKKYLKKQTEEKGIKAWALISLEEDNFV